jgi:hypothetical protein
LGSAKLSSGSVREQQILAERGAHPARTWPDTTAQVTSGHAIGATGTIRSLDGAPDGAPWNGSTRAIPARWARESLLWAPRAPSVPARRTTK